MGDLVSHIQVLWIGESGEAVRRLFRIAPAPDAPGRYELKLLGEGGEP